MKNFEFQGIVPMPGKLLIKFRINAKMLDLLEELGIKEIQRNEEAIAKKQFDAGAYDTIREDVAGNLRKDDGIQVFKGQNLASSLQVILLDLGQYGFKISDIHTFQKKGDDAGFLVIGLTIDGKEEILNHFDNLEKENKPLFDAIMSVVKRPYQNIFIWSNPDNSMTINANSATEVKKVEDLSIEFKDNEKFIVRILSDYVPA